MISSTGELDVFDHCLCSAGREQRDRIFEKYSGIVACNTKLLFVRDMYPVVLLLWLL